MQLPRPYDETLIAYLLGEGTEEDRASVAFWLGEGEENRLYLEQFAHTLKLVGIREDVKSINLDAEWMRFQELMQTETPIVPLHAPVEGEDIGEEQERRKPPVVKILIRALVAASIIIAAAYGFGLFDRNDTERGRIAHSDATSSGKIDSAMVVKLYLENTSAKARDLRLPDGSQIRLFPNSRLTYQVPSASDRRDVLLTGKAHFTVAKDKSRPFTVLTANLSTVAVGTQFMVTANPYGKQILVRLYEGKVGVSASRTASTGAMEKVFLDPGQELDYNMNAGTATIRNFGKGNRKQAKTNFAYNDTPSIPDYDNRSWFMFNNQSLAEIFDALGDMYDVKIVYSKKDINKMYFIVP